MRARSDAARPRPPAHRRHRRRGRRARPDVRRDGALRRAPDARCGRLAPWVGLIGLDSGMHRRRRQSRSSQRLCGSQHLGDREQGRSRRSARRPPRDVRRPRRRRRASSAGGCARARRSQRNVAALQSALIDSTLDGICLTDAEGNLLISNAPAPSPQRRARHAARWARFPERLLAMSGPADRARAIPKRMMELADSVGRRDERRVRGRRHGTLSSAATPHRCTKQAATSSSDASGRCEK